MGKKPEVKAKVTISNGKIKPADAKIYMAFNIATALDTGYSEIDVDAIIDETVKGDSLHIKVKLLVHVSNAKLERLASMLSEHTAGGFEIITADGLLYANEGAQGAEA